MLALFNSHFRLIPMKIFCLCFLSNEWIIENWKLMYGEGLPFWILNWEWFQWKYIFCQEGIFVIIKMLFHNLLLYTFSQIVQSCYFQSLNWKKNFFLTSSRKKLIQLFPKLTRKHVTRILYGSSNLNLTNLRPTYPSYRNQSSDL